jgi:hypothetical protein
MIDNRSIQHFLAQAGFYKDIVDGTYGSRSEKAARAYLLAGGHEDAQLWPPARCKVAVQQALMAAAGIHVGPIDGLVGPTFRYAIEAWQNLLRDQDPGAPVISHQRDVWPRQSGVTSFYGAPEQNQTMLKTPYPMKLSWDLSQEIHRFSIHAKVAKSAGTVLAKTLDHYGIDGIRKLRLDRFGGCLNKRPMRGSTARPSMHSWGIAIDFDPDRNEFRWGRDRAHFARAAYKPFLDFWEEEGWVSLGRERNFDWMHIQAARL